MVMFPFLGHLQNISVYNPTCSLFSSLNKSWNIVAAECEQIYQCHWRIKTRKRKFYIERHRSFLILALWANWRPSCFCNSVSHPLLNTPAAISLHNHLSCSACPAILDATRRSAICWLSRSKRVEQLYLAWNSLCGQVPDAVCNIAGLASQWPTNRLALSN
jgi:hypothetical protein